MLDFSRIEKINAEFKSVQENTKNPGCDSIIHLTPEQKAAWTTVLSSSASAEAEEEHLVRPLVAFFSFEPNVSEYISRHALDELRHASQLKVYLRETFSYVKTNRTLSDRIIYDQIFAKISPYVARRPLPFIATLMFYEIFAEDFYACLRAKAEEFSLPELATYLRSIQKDELRHRAGIKWLFSYWHYANLPVQKEDPFLMKLFMLIVKLDISTSWWAFWNRKLRRSLKTLGINANEFSVKAEKYGQMAREELASLSH